MVLLAVCQNTTHDVMDAIFTLIYSVTGIT